MKFDLTKIGYLSKPYAFKGELRCTLDILLLSEEFPKFIWLFLDGKEVPFFVEKASFNKQRFVLKLEDVSDEETAMKYKNSSIYCETKEFEKYFERASSLDDFIGFQVIDKNKGNIGKITGIIENSVQPTLEIYLEGKEILIPYNEDIVISINEKKKTINIYAPEGLIDLYLE